MNNLFTPDELIEMVDTLASIKAQISDLEARADTYKAALIAAKVQSVDGTQHRATVSESYRTTIHWEKIAMKLNPSPQLVRANTTTATEPTFTVRVTARKVSA